jgi:hypothetical protein
MNAFDTEITRKTKNLKLTSAFSMPSLGDLLRKQHT